jgi:hypothetical protein
MLLFFHLHGKLLIGQTYTAGHGGKRQEETKAKKQWYCQKCCAIHLHETKTIKERLDVSGNVKIHRLNLLLRLLENYFFTLFQSLWAVSSIMHKYILATRYTAASCKQNVNTQIYPHNNLLDRSEIGLSLQRGRQVSFHRSDGVRRDHANAFIISSWSHEATKINQIQIYQQEKQTYAQLLT